MVEKIYFMYDNFHHKMLCALLGDLSYSFWLLYVHHKIHLGKGSKIELIIFAEFSAKGGGYPPSVKIINFFPPKK